MIVKDNHYDSRFAARKAGAAFRQTAKTSGNLTDFRGIMKLKFIWKGVLPMGLDEIKDVAKDLPIKRLPKQAKWWKFPN